MNDTRRAGSFICVTDIQGIRHALRLTSITAVRDADEDRTETVIVVNGGRHAILVPQAMDSLLADLLEPLFSTGRIAGRPM
jgi:hypothetical protein